MVSILYQYCNRTLYIIYFGCHHFVSVVFPGFKSITGKRWDYLNLPDCSSCSMICLDPLSDYIYITVDFLSKRSSIANPQISSIWISITWLCRPILWALPSGCTRDMGLVCLPFNRFPAALPQSQPITEESRRSRPSRHSPSLWRSRFSALIGCQSAVLSSTTHRPHEAQIKL